MLRSSEAHILTSRGKVAVAERFLVSCPHECKTGGFHRTYTRRTLLEQHLRKSYKVKATKQEPFDLSPIHAGRGDKEWVEGCVLVDHERVSLK